jgi:hypothetical protein
MNRFLSEVSNDGSDDLSVRVTVDTTAVTDALTLRADALEASTAALLERIRILDDVSYSFGYNAYTEAARRKIASDMPYPSYVQISTVTLNGVSPTRVLNSSGVLVLPADATVDDVWQIVPTGGRNITISSSSVDLAQYNGRASLDIISTDGGLTFHIGEPGTAEVYGGGDFLLFTDASTSLWSAFYTNTASLRSADRFRLTLVPNYTPPTPTELTYRLLQRTFPTVTNDEYEFQIWSHKDTGYYVTQKDLPAAATTYKHFLGIQSSHEVVGSYPIISWTFQFNPTTKLFCVKTFDDLLATPAYIYLGRMKQTKDEYEQPDADNWYQDQTSSYSDEFELLHYQISGGIVFQIVQGTTSLQTHASPWSQILYMQFGDVSSTLVGEEEHYFVLKASDGSDITWS